MVLLNKQKCLYSVYGRLRRLSVGSLAMVCVLMLVGVYIFYNLANVKDQRRDVKGFLNKLKTADPDFEALDTTAADALKSKVRVLCLILTTENAMDVQARAVKYTWAKRCDKYFFVLTTWRRSPDIINTNVTESRLNIVHKVRQALQFIYTNYINDFDWLLKADDDTYVILENLRYVLSKYDHSKPGYMGYHYNKFINQGFMSGGAGYVISNAAVRMLVKEGINTRFCDVKEYAFNPENGEDLQIGICLEKLGVPVLSSLDSKNRETFHPNNIESHLFGVLPVYVEDMAMNPPQTGPDCCSRFTITYHYVSPEMMVVMDHLLYRTSVFGRNTKSDNDGSPNAFKIGQVVP